MFLKLCPQPNLKVRWMPATWASSVNKNESAASSTKQRFYTLTTHRQDCRKTLALATHARSQPMRTGVNRRPSWMQPARQTYRGADVQTGMSMQPLVQLISAAFHHTLVFYVAYPKQLEWGKVKKTRDVARYGLEPQNFWLAPPYSSAHYHSVAR